MAHPTYVRAACHNLAENPCKSSFSDDSSVCSSANSGKGMKRKPLSDITALSPRWGTAFDAGDLSDDSESSDQYYADVDSESDTDSDSDADAQYVIIEPESPWYKPPQTPCPPLDPELDNSLRPDPVFETDIDNAMRRMLLEEFCSELDRTIPGDAEYRVNITRFATMDFELLAHPREVFKRLCLDTAVFQQTPGCETKPMPDVPVDCLDDHDF
ncbi:hypothetical protein PLICRDRAFT_25916 [Plicaturopsis crispa FD-325 SS-3]|nr:hypothetical protein PLICRDRAFT_25916 [Plicaturopsis crispa FD-325 SS-3]